MCLFFLLNSSESEWWSQTTCLILGKVFVELLLRKLKWVFLCAIKCIQDCLSEQNKCKIDCPSEENKCKQDYLKS